MITIHSNAKEPITVKELKEVLKKVPDDKEVYFEQPVTVDAIQYAFIDDDGDLVFYNNSSEHDSKDADYVQKELIK